MNQRCYLCGCANPTTRDHIPPRGFFPEPRPSDLITVPCCRACNSSFASEDDYFRLVFSSLLDRSAAGDHVWDRKVLPRSVKRLPIEVDRILASCGDVALGTDSEPRPAVAFSVDPDRLHRYAVRLTKGLLAHHCPDYDYALSKFDVRLIPYTEDNLDVMGTYRDVLQYEEKGDAVFRYRYGLTDSGASGMWLTFCVRRQCFAHKPRPHHKEDTCEHHRY